jgi:hypothetical protein
MIATLAANKISLKNIGEESICFKLPLVRNGYFERA